MAMQLDQVARDPDPAGSGVARRLVGFCQHLRDNGFAIGLGEARDALTIATALDLSRPSQLRLALKPLLASRQEEARRFDALFDAYWLRRGIKRAMPASAPGAGQQPQRRSPVLDNLPGELAAFADKVERSDGSKTTNAAPSELRRGGASTAESLSRIDFRHLDDAETLQRVEELAERMAVALRRRLLRRRKAAKRGDRLDLRRMLHASIPQGGEPIDIFRKKPRHRPLRPVLLLDASGSMSQYSGLFLRFMLALLKSLPEGDGYLFHTRLVEIGPVLRERRRAKALERLALLSEGWGGGTRVGGGLKVFLQHHARHGLRGRIAVFILSHGYDYDHHAALVCGLASPRHRTTR